MAVARKWILLGAAALVLVIVILLVWYLYAGERSTSLAASSGAPSPAGGSQQPTDPSAPGGGSPGGSPSDPAAPPGYLQATGTPSVVPSGLTYTVWTSGSGKPMIITPAGAGATRGGTDGKSTVFLTKSSSGTAANCLNYDNTDWGPLDSGPGMWVANGCAGTFSVDNQPTQCGVKGQTGRYECPPGTMTPGWTA